MKRIIPIILAIIAITFMVSCRTTTKVIPSMTHDTVWQSRQSHDTIVRELTKTKHDSVYVHDSIWMHDVDGKTVIERWRTTDRWHLADVNRNTYQGTASTDTMFISRADTIRVPVPVEKKLTGWQRIKNDGRWMAVGCIVTLVIIVIIKRWRIRSNL